MPSPESDASDLRTSIENAARSRRKWPWVAGGATLAVLLAAGIGIAATRGGSRADAAGDGSPVRGGTLQFALIDYQRSPDPQWGTNYAESLIGNNVTDKLTWQDPKTGEITPWLAESWTYNTALTEFTFHLRKDVTFSDGTPFDSAAVKANFDQYVHGDPKLEINPNGAVLLPGYLETATPDPYTAVVRFAKPLASFLQASSFTANAQPGFLAPATLKLSAKREYGAPTLRARLGLPLPSPTLVPAFAAVPAHGAEAAFGAEAAPAGAAAVAAGSARVAADV
jgi:peptide/nickel transport system substrate-binding protein